jgi:hypothetical protein
MHVEAELRLAALSATQHGAFTREQALACGVSAARIDQYLRRGAWITLHRGVYSFVGTPATWERAEMAAVLWASPALVGGVAAAHLHGLPGFDAERPEILTFRKKIVPHNGVIVHVTRRLPDDHCVQVRGFPCASIERTLFDLCRLCTRRRAAIALDHALHMSLTTLGNCDFCLFLTARKGRQGCAVFRELVHARSELLEYPNSPLETVIFEMMKEHEVPIPSLQVPIYDDFGMVGRPDFVYEDERVVVEGHSKLWHTGTEAEERDSEKHSRLIRLGYEILYITWADATTYKALTAEKLLATLRGRAKS